MKTLLTVLLGVVSLVGLSSVSIAGIQQSDQKQIEVPKHSMQLAAQAKEEGRVEEKEESDEDQGFSLFD